jgi:cytochrome c-type biogenesis protein CcmH
MPSAPVTLLALLVALLTAQRPAHADVSARALEARLYAPCCWNGTLDVHESELARELRHEIETRLRRGETTQQIQADFVERFGGRVLANRDDRSAMLGSLLMGALMIGSALLLARFVHRSIQKGRYERHSPFDSRGLPDDAAREAQLDRELAQFD